MWGETRLFRKPPIWRCNQPNAHLQGFFDCRVVVKGGKLCQNALARDRPISVTMGPCLHDSMCFFLAYRDICLQLLQMFHCASHFGNLIHLSIDIPNKTAFALRKLKTSWYRVWEENTQCHLLQSHRQIINMLDQMFLGFL